MWVKKENDLEDREPLQGKQTFLSIPILVSWSLTQHSALNSISWYSTVNNINIFSGVISQTNGKTTGIL